MQKNKRYMRLLLFISVLLGSQLSVVAQKDTSAVLNAVAKLEKALLNKDSATMNGLLHKDVSYGHSSGWVQTKKEVVNDMMSGFLIYNRLEDSSINIVMSKDKAIVREKVRAVGSRDGKSFDLSLFITQVWLQSKKGWQLFARQSTKL